MDSWLAFVGVSAVIIMTPRQDTALTIRTTLAGGRAPGRLRGGRLRRALDAAIGAVLVALGGWLALERR